MAERKSLGRVRGGMTYAGSGITGSSTTATVFPGSGVTKAYPEDVYINTDTDESCGNVYSCVTGGDANTATWVYNGNIRGPQPPVENSLTSSSQTNALSAAMGKKLNEKIVDSGAFPLTFIPSCDQTTYVASITMENVDSEITITDVNGNVGTYTVTKSGTSDDRTETIPIDSSIGLASTGAVIASIESSDGVFKSVKFYNSMSTEIYSEEFKIWDHVIAVEENITPGTSISETYTEGGTQQTTYYKTGAISKLINGIRSALFPVTHAKAVWFNKHENTTVYDEIEDINTELTGIENIADCATGRDTAAKVVSLPGFVLKQNARIVVRFTDTGATNPVSGNLTLNVNGTGAKTIIDGHSNNATMTYANAGYFYNNQVCEFVYNGTAWVWLNRDTNTTYTGDTLKTKTAKTGSGSTVTGTIAANTKVDDAIGTLLNNDYALNQNLTELLNVTYDDTNHYIRVKDSNGTWHDAIYYNYNEPVALIPVMTSNTTPSGEASASSQNFSYYAYMAFDNDTATFWRGNSTTNEYLRYKFPSPVCVTRFNFIPQYASVCRVKTYKIQASNDGTSWDDLFGGVTENINYTSSPIIQDINNNQKYLYYQIFVIDNYATSTSMYASVTGLQFYGYE